MKLNNFLIIVFLFCILSVNIFAFSTLQNYGNAQASASCPGWLWTSCFPQSKLDLNFSNDVIISQSMDFMPIVNTNMLDSLDPTFTERYIYTFSGVTANIYTGSTGGLYSSSVLPGKFISKPFFYRPELFQGSYLVGVMNVSNVYKVVWFSMDSDKNLILEYNKTISNKSIYYDSRSPVIDGFLPVILNNGTIYIYTIDGTYYGSVEFGVVPDSNMRYTNPDQSNLMTVGDINGDGHDDLYIAIPYTTTDASYRYVKIRYAALDIYNQAWLTAPMDIEVSKGLIGTNTAYNLYSVNNAIIRYGTLSSSNKIYTNIRIDISANPITTTKYNQSFNLILSSSGSVLYNDFETVVNTRINSNFIFTDANYDGLIESCYCKNGGFNCYNAAFVSIASAGCSAYYRYAMGKFTNNSYMSFINKDGIYDMNGTISWNVKNFTTYDTWQLPVSLFQKINYSNDIIAVANANIYLRQISSIAAVCGDSICSAFENPLTCAIDCFNANISIPSGLIAYGDPCNQDSDCQSGLCDMHKCILKGKNEACSSDSQCLSGDCVSGTCSDPGTYASLNQAKNEIFGDSEFDGLMLFFIIAVILVLAGIIMGIVMANIMPPILALVGIIIVFVIFTFFGWIPAWIIIVLAILLMIFAFILFMVFKKGT